MTKPADKNTVPTVHVVDDDDAMRRALDTLFSTVGYQTAVFSRASEFLANFTTDSAGSGHGDVPMAVQAMKEGAFEFIQKPFRNQDLLDRINHALKQDAEFRNVVARRAEVLHRLESLTPRERQVMDMVVDGAANKVIAIDLDLSERTVEIHRAKVMEKMGARSVAHLVKLHLTLTDKT